MTDQTKEYGLTAVPANTETLFNQANLSIKPAAPFIPVSETPIPDTPLSKRIQEYARSHLPEPTFHHSMRVYHYGLAIKRYAFPVWEFSDETYFLTCMLHDIGTTRENLNATKLSFEFYGGYLALDVLRNDPGSDRADANASATQAQAESVAEAIIRHQDIRDVGTITAVGQLVQLATIFDNIGGHSQLVHDDTVKNVIEHWPRLKWSSCFATTVGQEVELKPWAHTTALGDFQGSILKNPYNEFE
ncbi:putative urea hydro-lyase/cyanamide hydratase [Aspergillus undulatus]|uniref:putative urea hydro-lyase/cyanamide hydratase n=1 Tax=Aspergillus undulatus TaxID=1810928 RepID=UPI003CCCF8F3